MKKGWRKVKFREILFEPVRNGIYKEKEYHGRGQKIINMGEIFNYDYISDQAMKCVELDEKEKEKYSVKNGDLLFARRSLVLAGAGKCSIVINPSETTTFESSIIRARLNKGIADPKYYFYYFHSPVGRALITSIATRTAVSGIRGSELMELKVDLIPLSTQRRIASILSAYDDLIENNNRRIKIHEEMAQAIYREWFVEFRAPGIQLRKATAEEKRVTGKDVFPEGWEIGEISRMVEIQSGYAFRSDGYNENGQYGLVTIRNVQDGYFENRCDSYIDEIPKNMPAHCMLTNGDILISLTGNTGRICIVYGAKYLLNQRVAKLSPIKNVYKPLIYCLFRSPDMQKKIELIASGVAQQNLSPIETAKMKIVLPSNESVNMFHKMCNPYIDGMSSLLQKNELMQNTRDLLLPKLVGGEVEV